MGEKLFPVHIACNDPDNGNFYRKAQAINFLFSDSSAYCELGMTASRYPAFDYAAGYMRLSRAKYRVHRSEQWVGNWCWNAFYLDALNASRMIFDLMRDKRWAFEGGLVESGEAWDRQDNRAFMQIWARDLFPPKPIQLIGSVVPHPTQEP